MLGIESTNGEERTGQAEHIHRGKKHQPEQVLSVMRQIGAAVANGNTTGQVGEGAGIVELTYLCWLKEYDGSRWIRRSD